MRYDIIGGLLAQGIYGCIALAGQGMNTTIEDVAVLGRTLQEKGICPEALRAFELERIPRIGVITSRENVRSSS